MSERIYIFIILLFSISLGSSGDSLKVDNPDNFHLFLLAGQSNMAGRGIVEDEDKQIHPGIFMLSREGQWKPAVDPIHFDKKVAGVGLAKSFALSLLEKDSNVIIGLVPAACGGSPISAWEPGSYFKATGSHPYDDAISWAKKAMKKGTLKGILWHQGESDSSPEKSGLYKEKLRNLIERFRKDLNSKDLPFIIGQLGQFPGDPWDEAKNEVNNAHTDIAREMDFVAFVSSDSLTSKPDNIHFDTKSLREFGRRYAKKYLQMTK